MAKKLILDSPEFTGLCCDSEKSQLLDTPGIPKVTCDMRNVSGMFPPAFNKLRELLFEEHYDLWCIVGGMMIYNHDLLFEHLNKELDCCCDPRLGMQACCEKWIAALNGRIKHYRFN